MGGRGTRITFVSNIELSTRDLPGVPAVLESAVSKAIEFFVTVLVPQNFRKVAHAIGGLLDTKPAHGKATSTKG